MVTYNYVSPGLMMVRAEHITILIICSDICPWKPILDSYSNTWKMYE